MMSIYAHWDAHKTGNTIYPTVSHPLLLNRSPHCRQIHHRLLTKMAVCLLFVFFFETGTSQIWSLTIFICHAESQQSCSCRAERLLLSQESARGETHDFLLVFSLFVGLGSSSLAFLFCCCLLSDCFSSSDALLGLKVLICSKETFLASNKRSSKGTNESILERQLSRKWKNTHHNCLASIHQKFKLKTTSTDYSPLMHARVLCSGCRLGVWRQGHTWNSHEPLGKVLQWGNATGLDRSGHQTWNEFSAGMGPVMGQSLGNGTFIVWTNFPDSIKGPKIGKQIHKWTRDLKSGER